ncbi:hypothetical protein LCGC14_2927370, partial [marine sediment metagenome]
RWSPLFRKGIPAVWASDIERLIRIDGVSAERIRAVVDWLPSDDGRDSSGSWKGWRTNILSGKKLREKFDKLEIAMQPKEVSSGLDANGIR